MAQVESLPSSPSTWLRWWTTWRFTAGISDPALGTWRPWAIRPASSRLGFT